MVIVQINAGDMVALGWDDWEKCFNEWCDKEIATLTQELKEIDNDKKQ